MSVETKSDETTRAEIGGLDVISRLPSYRFTPNLGRRLISGAWETSRKFHFPVPRRPLVCQLHSFRDRCANIRHFPNIRHLPNIGFAQSASNGSRASTSDKRRAVVAT